MKHPSLLAKRPVLLPHNITLNHIYTLDREGDGLSMAADAGIKFNLDCFGCSPLTYAIMLKDQGFVDTIIGWIHAMEPDEKNRVLRHCVTSNDLFSSKSKQLVQLADELF